MPPILLMYYSVSGYQIYCTIYCMTPNKKHLCMCVCKRRWGSGGRGPKKLFRSLGPQFDLKIRGEGGPPGALPWIRHCCIDSFNS